MDNRNSIEMFNMNPHIYLYNCVCTAASDAKIKIEKKIVGIYFNSHDMIP